MSYLAALGVGIVFVLVMFPPELLLSGAVPDARLNGDVAQHVAGQRAFIEDDWHWPLLRTTLLDWPGGLNIAMTDSNPLVALPLKLFRFLLPPGFSAVQLWLALAYLLQPVAAVFALRSAGETRLLPAAAVAVFAISMPTFLFRHTHSALSSHFVLLMVLAAYFRVTETLRGRRLLPLVLLPASFLIHPYLAFMSFAVLAAAPVSLVLRGDRRWLAAAVTVVAAVLLTVLAAVVLGYQAATPSGGFGEASMNLISPFYPAYSSIFDLPLIDATGVQYEGYQYLGLGLLVLLAFCVVAVVWRGQWGFLPRHLGLVLGCLGLTAMAVSNVVYFGLHKVVDLGPVPDVFQQLRASGRLFWPVAYVLLVGGVVGLARLAPARVAAVLLLGTALLQLGDARQLQAHAARDFRARMVMTVDPVRLDKLLTASTNMTMLPTFGCGADANVPVFMQLLLASTRHRVAANTMYVARFARLQDCADTAAARRPLAAGELRVFLPLEAAAGAFAVPDGARLCRRLATLAVCTLRTDLLAGLAPVEAPTLPLGRTVSLAVPNRDDFLGPGWYSAEPFGVWTIDHTAIMAFQDNWPAGDLAMVARADGYTGSKHPQHVTLYANGQSVAAWDLPSQNTTTLRAVIKRTDFGDGPLLLRFEIATPTRPSAAGTNRDTRQLGMFLRDIRFDPAPPAR